MNVATSACIGGAGNCCLDYLFVAPQVKAGGLSHIQQYKTQHGGLTAMALTTCARLGAKTEFISVLGNDQIAGHIMYNLKKCGIDCSHIVTVPQASSPVSFIHIDSDTGERTIYHHLDQRLKTHESYSFEPLNKCDILLVDDVYPRLGLAAARHARSRNIITVADTTPHDDNLEFLKEIDVLISSCSVLDESQMVKLLQKYISFGPATVILTLGKRGWVMLHQGKITKEKGFDVPVVDTTGAGDVFHGAFAFGVSQKWPFDYCARFASASAALKCMKLGGGLGIPTLDEVNQFLKNSNEPERTTL